MPKKNISGKNVEIWKKPLFWILIVLGISIIGVIIFLTMKQPPKLRKNCQGCENEQCCNGKCIDTTKYKCVNGSACDKYKSCGNNCCNDQQSCNDGKCGPCKNTVDAKGNTTRINLCTGSDTCCQKGTCKTRFLDKNYPNMSVIPFKLNESYNKDNIIVSYNEKYYTLLKDSVVATQTPDTDIDNWTENNNITSVIPFVLNEKYTDTKKIVSYNEKYYTLLKDSVVAKTTPDKDGKNWKLNLNMSIIPFKVNASYNKNKFIIFYNKNYYTLQQDSVMATKTPDNDGENWAKINTPPKTYCCNSYIGFRVGDDGICYNDVCSNGQGCSGLCYGENNDKCCELTLSKDKKTCGVSCPEANKDNICPSDSKCVTNPFKKNACKSSTCNWNPETGDNPQNYYEDYVKGKPLDSKFKNWKYSTVTADQIVAETDILVDKDSNIILDKNNEPLFFIMDKDIGPKDSKLVKFRQITQKDYSNNFCYEPKNKTNEKQQECINKQYIWNSNAKSPYCSKPLIGNDKTQPITKRKEYKTKKDCESKGFIWNGCSTDDCSSIMNTGQNEEVMFDPSTGICKAKIFKDLPSQKAQLLVEKSETSETSETSEKFKTLAAETDTEALQCPFDIPERCCYVNNDKKTWTGQICPPKIDGTTGKTIEDRICSWNATKNFCDSIPPPQIPFYGTYTDDGRWTCDKNPSANRKFTLKYGSESECLNAKPSITCGNSRITWYKNNNYCIKNCTPWKPIYCPANHLSGNEFDGPSCYSTCMKDRSNLGKSDFGSAVCTDHEIDMCCTLEQYAKTSGCNFFGACAGGTCPS